MMRQDFFPAALPGMLYRLAGVAPVEREGRAHLSRLDPRQAQVVWVRDWCGPRAEEPGGD